MMNRLRKLISIASLARTMRHGGPAYLRGARGQVAIFLLLGVVVVLVLALAMANLGVASTSAVQVANAADAAALDLGSTLASKANQYYEALGRSTTGQCQRTGFLGVFAAIVVAIASIVTGQLYGLEISMMLLGAIGGAIGGALGEGIVQGSLTGALRGAIQGAIIGASIGHGIQTGMNFGAGFAGSEGATVFVNTAGEVAGGFTQSVGALGSIPANASLIGGSTLATAGAVGGGTLASGSQVYNAVVQDQIRAEIYARFIKAINGLPEDDRVREGALFAALSRTVDDPNKTFNASNTSGACYWQSSPSAPRTPITGDRRDTDGDGDRAEQVPCFQAWWAEHFEAVRLGGVVGAADARERIRVFLRDVLGPFAKRARDPNVSDPPSTTDEILSFLLLHQADRSDVECALSVCPTGAGVVEGPAVEAWRKLRADTLRLRGVTGIPFWEPGPDRERLHRWYNQASADEPLPPGFDQVDNARLGYEYVIDAAISLLGKELELSEEELSSAEAAYRNWIPLLYDPHSSGDLYASLRQSESHMGEWGRRTQEARGPLPDCRLADGPYTSPTFTTRPMASGCGPAYSNGDPANPNLNNPFHQCRWVRQPSDPGTHVSNPSCAVNERVKRSLTAQITSIEQIAANANASLREEVIAAEPCRLRFGTGWWLERGDIPDTEIRADLRGNTLSYSYQANYVCAHQVPETCTGSPPVCIPAHVEESPEQRERRSGQLAVSAPGLTIQEQSLAGFRGALTDFRRILDGLRLPFATIDEDVEDEVQPVVDAVNAEQRNLRNYLDRLRDFYAEMERNLAGPSVALRHLEYPWTDARGEHRVAVDVGPFRFAGIGTEESGNFFMGKKCQVLRNFTDGGTAWVRVTRQDPTSEIGPVSGDGHRLWSWNAFLGGGQITKCSSASYSFDRVNLHHRCPDPPPRLPDPSGGSGGGTHPPLPEGGNR